jgi:hypothetical protein
LLGRFTDYVTDIEYEIKNSMERLLLTKRMFDTRPRGKRGIGTPKLRWGIM